MNDEKPESFNDVAAAFHVFFPEGALGRHPQLSDFGFTAYSQMPLSVDEAATRRAPALRFEDWRILATP